MKEEIWNIISSHNEDEWLAECRKIFPAVPEAVFFQAIELFLRQDIEDVWED